MKYKFLVLKSISIIFLLIGQIKVNAQENPDNVYSPEIKIKPAILEVNMKLDAVRRRIITFENNSDKSFAVKVEAIGYKHQKQKELEPVFQGQDLIKFKQDTFLIGPYASRKFLFSIVTKDEIPYGSYFVTILFKPVFPQEYYTAESARIIPQIGAVLAINITPDDFAYKEDYLNIEKFAAEKQDRKIAIDLVYNNQDLFYRKTGGEIYIQDIFGNNKEVINIPYKNLLPKHEDNFTYLSEKKLGPGLYKVILKIGDRQYYKTEERRVLVWFSTEFIISFYLFVLVIGAVWKRKEIVLAWKALKYGHINK